MDKVNRWGYVQHIAYLSSAFGLELAIKKFGLSEADLAAQLGRYKKGKRVGALKGKLIWYKVVHGGWVKTGAYDFDNMRARGFVARPGTCFGFAIVDDYASEYFKLVHPLTAIERDVDAVNVVQSLIRTLDDKRQNPKMEVPK